MGNEKENPSSDEIIGNLICLMLFFFGIINLISSFIWVIVDLIDINKDPNSNWWWRLMGGIVCLSIYQIIIEIRKRKN